MRVYGLQVGNFRVEPPSLFRGRGEHPKMGKIKSRVYPRDITINIGPGAKIPEHPYEGQRWKEVREWRAGITARWGVWGWQLSMALAASVLLASCDVGKV